MWHQPVSFMWEFFGDTILIIEFYTATLKKPGEPNNKASQKEKKAVKKARHLAIQHAKKFGGKPVKIAGLKPNRHFTTPRRHIVQLELEFPTADAAKEFIPLLSD